MNKAKRKIRVAVTMGDPSGIGPAITAKAISRLRGLAEFIVIGDRGVFEKAQGAPRLPANCKFVDLDNVSHKNFEFGKIKAEYGRASIEYLDKALELIKNKHADCLVTCPISKEAINLAGYKYSGHTEYLSQKSGIKDTVMLLFNRGLKIGLVTRHIALKDVPRQLNRHKIDSTISLIHRSLKRLFLINSPRLVVCGLNPHASDNGLIGNEENRIIKPVLEKLRKRIKHLDGPLSADVAIAKAAHGRYDCAIAMYHDQALIPLKLSDTDKGVNLTLGLSFIRTSPLHGTAFDIAGRNTLVNPNSLIEAIKLAVKCTVNFKKELF